MKSEAFFIIFYNFFMKNTSIHVIPFQCPDLTNCRISAITMYLLIYFVEADDAAL